MEGAVLCKNKGHGTVKYHLKEIELTFPNFYFGQQIDAVIRNLEFWVDWQEVSLP